MEKKKGVDHKRSYLGIIAEKRTETVKNEVIDFDGNPFAVNDNNDLPKKYEIHKIQEYSNRRNIMFCSCGHTFELRKTINDKLEDTNLFYDCLESVFNPFSCDKCKKEYKESKDFVYLGSNFANNVVTDRMSCFVRDDKIKLVKFTRRAGVNVSSKKLFFKKSNISICFNKNTRRFYFVNKIRGKRNVKSFGVSNIKNALTGCISSWYSSAICSIQTNEQAIKDKEGAFVKPLNKFFDLLLEQIDERDRSRVEEIVEEGHLKPETFINLSEVSQDQRIKELSAYIDNISVIISILQIPSLSNVLFTKGKEFFLGLIKMEFFPRPSFIKRKNPTSPTDIIEEIIRQRSYSQLFFTRASYKKSSMTMESEELKTLKDKYKNTKNAKISPKLYKELNGRDDINSLGYIFENNFPLKKFYHLCDTNGIRKTLNVMNLYYRRRIYNHGRIHTMGEDDFLILKHIMKIYVREEKGKNKLQSIFGDINPNERYVFKNFDINIYNDTIRFVNELELGLNVLLDCKTWVDVVYLHDDLAERMKCMKLEIYNKKIQEFTNHFKSIKFYKSNNDVEFNLISTSKELAKESTEMHHCVGTYADRVARGMHLIFSIKGKNKEDRATLEFGNTTSIEGKIEYNKINWRLGQLKAKYNAHASNNVIDAVHEFCKNQLKTNKINYTIPEYSKNGDLKKIEE